MDSNTGVAETASSENKDLIEIEIPFALFQYLSTEQCNLQNICRICLSISDKALCPLFLYKDNVLANMLMAIAEVQISEDDGLPSNICENCQKEIMNCYDFKNKCLQSDYTLRSVLKGEFYAKEDTSGRFDPTNTGDILKDSNENDDVFEQEIQAQYTDIDYLQDIKDSMSDDEAVCIVGETQNNEKKIAIIKSDDTNNLIGKIVLQKSNEKIRKFKQTCTQCPKKFHKLKSLRAHISKRHPESNYPFPCSKCKNAYTSEFDLRLHTLLHNSGPNWTCTECLKEFNGKTAFRRHIQRHMQSKRFRCVVCGKAFVELYALRRHSRVHTGAKVEKKLACQYCDKRYGDRSALSAHESAHSGARPAACGACDKTFPNARLLASHRRVHSADKPHVCHHCGKRFRHESTRNTHVRTHTGERPYECALCGKTFIQRSNMTQHMRTHTGERPYSCKYCERKFSSRSTLKSHERTHTGERPYTCKICGKSFARLNLKLHMRLHTGERPHACTICPKRFTSAGHLREHQRIHTGEKPFECAMCSKNFPTKSHLIKHVRSHEKKKGKGVFMSPVKVSDKSIRIKPQIKKQTDTSSSRLDCITEYIILKDAANLPNNDTNTLCTVEETPLRPEQELLCQDENLKTEVIVVGTEQSLMANGIAYMSNDLNCTNNLQLVTVNEGEMNLTDNTILEGTAMKVYQYDQSLLQINSGSGQLTISRISSKMTTNF